ncbi:LysR family transcriptional regulator [Lactobacillus psittaci]|nr:LysR family transcriptional regulator [Lactobacillus psittaci]
MNLRHLEFFVELAKTEHMPKAAENLGISQPSLSYAINNLEDELGIPLFEKDGRNIKLTNYGRVYLHYVEEALATLRQGDEYINELQDVTQGHIHLGFTYTMGQDLVPEIVANFLKQDKFSEIEFSYSQDITDKLIEDLLLEKLDLVFASKATTPKLASQVNQFKLADQELLAAVPNDHPLAQKDSVNLAELAQYPMVLYQRNSGLGIYLNELFERAGIEPNVALEVQEDHSVLGFVHYNFGVAIVPHMSQLDTKIVKLIKIDDEAVVHPIYAITKANHFLPPAVMNFEEFAHNYAKKHFKML